MSDDTYYRNELALTGLDAWITREPDYDEGPPEPEPCCPEFTDMCTDKGHDCCDQCGGCLTCDLVLTLRESLKQAATVSDWK